MVPDFVGYDLALSADIVLFEFWEVSVFAQRYSTDSLSDTHGNHACEIVSPC